MCSQSAPAVGVLEFSVLTIESSFSSSDKGGLEEEEEEEGAMVEERGEKVVKREVEARTGGGDVAHRRRIDRPTSLGLNQLEGFPLCDWILLSLIGICGGFC